MQDYYLMASIKNTRRVRSRVGATRGGGGGGRAGRRGNGEHGVYIFGGECMVARREDSAKRKPSTLNIFDVASTDFPNHRCARIPCSGIRARRECGSGLRAWETLLRSRQPIFQLSMSWDMFCTHFFVLTSLVGLEQYHWKSYFQWQWLINSSAKRYAEIPWSDFNMAFSFVQKHASQLAGIHALIILTVRRA
jgi:hypothetical protein